MPAHEMTGLVFFGGGVDTTKDPITVNDGQVIASENFIPEGDGVTLRPGLNGQCASNAGVVYNFIDVADFKNRRVLIVASKTTVFATTGTTQPLEIGSITNTGNIEDSVWSGASIANTYFLATPKDEVKTWNGTTIGVGQLVNLKDVSGYTGPASLKARYAVGFAGRPILGYVTDADGTNPHRVRWAQRTTLTVGSGWKNWTGTGAGATDLDEHPGYITGMTVFNGILVIFKSESIVFGFETGDSTNPIRFQRGGNVGCVNGRTFAPLTPDTGIFLSKNGFYMLTAGGVSPMGDEVRRYLFGPSTEQTTGRVVNVNSRNVRMACAWIEPIEGAYWCAVPLDGANQAYSYFALAYDPKTERWTPHYFASAIVGATNKTYIDSVDGTLQPTKTRALLATFATNGTVVKFDPDVNYDISGGNAIDAYFKTKDLRFNPAGAATIYAVHVHMTMTGSASPNVSGTLTLDIDGDRQEDASKLTISQAFSFSSSVKSQTITIPVHKNAEGYRKHQTAIFHRFKLTVTQNSTTSGVSLSIPAVEFEWLPRWNIQYPTTA